MKPRADAMCGTWSLLRRSQLGQGCAGSSTVAEQVGKVRWSELPHPSNRESDFRPPADELYVLEESPPDRVEAFFFFALGARRSISELFWSITRPPCILSANQLPSATRPWPVATLQDPVAWPLPGPLAHHQPPSSGGPWPRSLEQGPGQVVAARAGREEAGKRLHPCSDRGLPVLPIIQPNPVRRYGGFIGGKAERGRVPNVGTDPEGRAALDGIQRTVAPGG